MRRLLRLLAMLPLAASCSVEEMLDDFAPDDQVAFSQQHLALYSAGDTDAIIEQLSGKVRGPGIEDTIAQVVEYVPAGEHIGVELIGYFRRSGPDTDVATLSFQYEFPDTWLTASVQLDVSELPYRVLAVNVNKLPTSLQELHAFRLFGNGIQGVIVVFFCVAIPIFCLVSFVFCLRTPIPKRKWLWAIFTLCGLGSVTMNWTTGEIGQQLLSLQLLGSGIQRGGLYGPWLLSFAMPFGAIAFWARRKEWFEEAAKADEPEPPAASGTQPDPEA